MNEVEKSRVNGEGITMRKRLRKKDVWCEDEKKNEVNKNDATPEVVKLLNHKEKDYGFVKRLPELTQRDQMISVK